MSYPRPWRGLGGATLHSPQQGRCILPIGYRCVYSEEFQPKGLSRHLSVSVERPGKLPSIEAVAMIELAFGFESKDIYAGNCCVFLEEAQRAVNVIEIIEGEQ